MKESTKIIKKKIIYKCSHTGTRETDLLYKIIILNKLDLFDLDHLKLLLDLLENYSDKKIFSILTNQCIPEKKYKTLIYKIINE